MTWDTPVPVAGTLPLRQGVFVSGGTPDLPNHMLILGQW
jgi:hypothetical protein